MMLDVEVLVNGGLDVQEALGQTRRFETLLFPLSTSEGLMREVPKVVEHVFQILRPRHEHTGEPVPDQQITAFRRGTWISLGFVSESRRW